MHARISLFALVIGAAVAANAQVGGEVVAGPRTPVSQIGIGVGLGGGVNNFVASEMTNATDIGGNWDVRAVVGTRLPIAGEVAYIGSYRNLHVAGVTGTSALQAHGAEAAARVQYPYLTGRWLIEPFAFGGFGYSHLSVDGTVAASSTVKTTGDDILIVPFGAGVTAGWNNVLFEARFTYRATFNQDLLAKPDGTIASLNNWSAGATVGYEF